MATSKKPQRESSASLLAEKPGKAIADIPVLDRRYETNYLKTVVARVDFASPIELDGRPVERRLRKAVRSEFPLYEQGVSLEPDITEVVIEDKEVRKLKVRDVRVATYSNPNKKKKAAFSEEYIWLEYQKYESFDVLKSDFTPLTEALKRTKDLRIKRFGLRYINEIELKDESGSPLEWEKYLDERLLGTIDIPDTKAKISRVGQALELNIDDTHFLRLAFGIPKPDYPQPVKRKLAMLDIDTYASGLFEIAELSGLLEVLHNRAKTFFEKSIKDELRVKMRIQR